MSTLVTFDGTGLADGHALVAGDAGTGDTVVLGVSASPPVVDVDLVPYGRPGEVAVIADNNGVASYADFSLGGSKTQARSRFNFKTPAAWSATAVTDISSFCAANLGRRAGIVLAGSGQPGQLRLIGGSATAITTSPTNLLALNTWYRMEFWIDIQSSTVVKLNCKLFDIAGNLLWNPAEGTGSPGGVDTQVFQLGIPATTPRNIISYAHLKVTDVIGTDIGPWYTPPVTSKVVRSYNGTAEVARVARMFNGTSEVAVSVN